MSHTAPSESNLVWIDLQMTGLDLLTDRIVEIGCIVTNKDLEILEPGKGIVIHQPEVLQNMNEWSREFHSKSGLTQAVRDSKVDTQEAEQIVLEYVKRHCPERGCPMTGNTISLDKAFLNRYMPQLNYHLSDDVIDVSVVMDLCYRWNPRIYLAAPKELMQYRVLADIERSIRQLAYYKEHIFTSPLN